MVIKVALDPGHGGIDPGAVGGETGLLEKEINLNLARELGRLLEARGLEVLLTRHDDRFVSLPDRAALINSSGADLVVSLHVNSSGNREASYLSSHVFKQESQGAEVGKVLLDHLARFTGWPNGGVRVNNFFILRETRPPAVLLEVGFISNPEQEKFLSVAANQTQLARVLASGLVAWSGVEEPVFTDIAGHWAEEDIEAVAHAGLMSGYADGSFRPDAPATRAELAAALHRLIQKTGAEG